MPDMDTDITELNGDENFSRYSSIENHYQEGFIDRIRASYGNSLVCSVTEKIHGSNFCIEISNKGIKFGSRNKYLPENENFHNHEKATIKAVKGLEKLYNSLVNVEKVRIYGEMFGGSYNHPEVPKTVNASKIQKGVFYSPDNNFLAFDIKLDKEYLSQDAFFKLCELYDIPHVKMLFKGNLQECLEYKNDFESTIYEYYNLPKIENNIAEGIVIKPHYLNLNIGQHRVVVKSKNETFKEVSERPKRLKEHKELSEELITVISDMSRYVTEQRLDNVLSKVVGEVDMGRLGELLGLYTIDLLDDYNKDSDLLKNLEKEDERLVKKKVNSEIVNLIKNRLMEL